jgi:hypothetical protein
MGAIRENVHLHNFVFSKLINQFTPNNTVRETDPMNYLLVIQKPSFMQQLAELILKFLLDNRQRLTTCCKKKHLINSSKQRTNDIPKSVGFPLTMGPLDPWGNGIFLANVTRPCLTCCTVLLPIACLHSIPSALTCIMPVLASTATYTPIINNKKCQCMKLHGGMFVPSPSPYVPSTPTHLPP